MKYLRPVDKALLLYSEEEDNVFIAWPVYRRFYVQADEPFEKAICQRTFQVGYALELPNDETWLVDAATSTIYGQETWLIMARGKAHRFTVIGDYD